MRVLIADKFEQSGRDGLQAIGCEVSYQPDLKDEALVEAITEGVAGCAGRARHQSHRTDAGGRSNQAGGSRRRRLQHDRRGGRFKTWNLCFQLSGQKFDRRGGAGVCV